MIDPRIIFRRLEKIKQNMSLLREAAETPFEQFVSDALLYSATERVLQVSIQAVMDICSYLVKESQAKMPEEHKGLPAIVRQMGVIPKDLAERLTCMMGMRNVLVHMYTDIDLDKVYQSLLMDIGDFDEFARHVVAYLEKEGLSCGL